MLAACEHVRQQPNIVALGVRLHRCNPQRQIPAQGTTHPGMQGRQRGRSGNMRQQLASCADTHTNMSCPGTTPTSSSSGDHRWQSPGASHLLGDDCCHKAQRAWLMPHTHMRTACKLHASSSCCLSAQGLHTGQTSSHSGTHGSYQ